MAALALPGILVLAAFALLPIARLIVLAMEEADGLRPSVFVGPRGCCRSWARPR